MLLFSYKRPAIPEENLKFADEIMTGEKSCEIERVYFIY